jgi:outer membrane protein, heavy metal efflux system
MAQQPGDSLSLDSALAIARTHRGQVAVAAAMVSAARADWRTGTALPNPTASYSYTGDTPRQHATVDQPLDWLLQRGGASAAGRAGVQAAQADSVRILAEVDRQATTAYYGVVAASRRLALGADEAAVADSLAALAARRLAAGEISPLEEAQAALEAARARQLLSADREAYAVAVANLARALGVAAESLPPASDALDAGIADTVLDAVSIDEIPLVAAAQAQSEAATARFRAARLSRIPFPSLQAGAEWDNDGTGTTVILGLSLPLPLWQSGGAQSALAGARAQEAEATLREVRGDAVQLLAETSTRVRETERRARLSRDSIVPLAQRQRDLALLAFQAGETGMVPVLEALRAEREVARELVSDLLAYQAARADWNALVGGSR